jgi:CotH protein/lamin tail-like protein
LIEAPMRFLTHIILFAGMGVIGIQTTAQELVINEFMARNQSTLPDFEGDYSDWIEVYNPSSNVLSLLDYGLSDDPDQPGMWKFPALTLPPFTYLLVFASGKMGSETGELHTCFRISGDGEEILLTDPGGSVIDKVGPVSLAPDEVYGRLPDGGEAWTRMLKPTPASANVEHNELALSHPGGFYLSPFKLSISSSNGDAIRFRLDGKEPGPDDKIFDTPLSVNNNGGTTTYLSQIPSSPPQSMINYKAWKAPTHPVERIMVIRFASFKGGERTSDLYSASYLVDEKIMNRYSMPVVSLLTDPSNLVRSDSGIYVPGVHFDKADPQWTGNYFQKGKQWEKPVHLEYFEADGHAGFTQDAGLRIHGMMTRQAAQKSLRIYAREEYGSKEISYPLLPQRTNTSYKRILLRSSMCSWNGNTVFCDELSQEIARGLDMENQEYNPIVLYLNGEYWGIHTMRDRIDERYLAYMSGEDKDSVDLIGGNYMLVEAGSNQHYMELASYIEEHDLAVDEHYRHVTEQVDLSSLIDYMITEIFFTNKDWPGNNQKCWRPQTPVGKWRWILYDLDAGFGKSDRDLIQQFSTDADDLPWEKADIGTFLLKRLLKNQEFEHLFISRFAELLNNEFSAEITTGKINLLMEMYEDELPNHIDRWDYPQSLSHWKSDIYDEVISFLQRRPCYLARQLNQYFDAGLELECPSVPEESNILLVVPNPSNGIFGIFNSSPKAFIGRALMCTSDGRIVSVEEQVFIPSNEQIELTYSHLGSGIYFLYLVNEFQVERKRVLIIQ